MNRRTMLLPIRFALVFVVSSVLATFAFAASGTASSGSTPASDPAPAAEKTAPAPSLATVQWSSGSGVSLDSLKGKTTIVMPFVTWCPKCNAWAPEMVEQLKKAIEDKPVVVVAVGTDVGAAAAKDFIIKKGLTGPNVLYGANPKMNEQLGVDPANLWNYVWIGPEGKATKKGAIGVFYAQGEKKDFVVPHELAAAKDLGKLQFLDPAMSPAVKNLVWPIEMGDVAMLVKVSQPKNLRSLPKEDQQSLSDMSTKFLDEQLASAKDLVSGDVPKKIEAFDKASQIAAAFRSTPQGKEANKIVLDLNGDAAFKKELAARKLYDQSVAKAAGDDAKLAKTLHVVVQRFPETFYGDLAKQKIDGASK